MRTALKTIFPPDLWQLVEAVKQTAVSLNMPLYFVGGLVRDLLLQRPPTDLDMVVEGDAVALARAVAAQYGGQVVAHPAFGTAVWRLNEAVWHSLGGSLPQNTDLASLKTVDFVTARQEIYKAPAALPTVTPGSIEQDLWRRDFTINTMALRLDGNEWGQLLDPYQGQQDLRDGVVRVLHHKSFVDDPTRMLRAVRYAQRLNLTLAADTAVLLKEALPYLKQTTGIRLWHELAQGFQAPKPAEMMTQLAQLGVLQHIETGLDFRPESGLYFDRLASCLAEETTLEAETAVHIHLLLWLLPLPEEVQTAVLQRFALANRVQTQIGQARKSGAALIGLPEAALPSQIVPHLEPLSSWGLLGLKCLFGNPTQLAWLTQYESSWQHIKPTIDGTDLQKMGLTPGPHFKQILAQLKQAWLDGEVANAAAEKRVLDRLLQGFLE